MNTTPVITNFRDHPSLRYDDCKLVFKIDDKTYLISEKAVRQIIPKSIFLTNIGEPYKSLVRLTFVFVDEDVNTEYDEVIDFDSDYEEELRGLLHG